MDTFEAFQDIDDVWFRFSHCQILNGVRPVKLYNEFED